jgi:hypothetical protein
MRGRGSSRPLPERKHGIWRGLSSCFDEDGMRGRENHFLFEVEHF